ncbi:hypothetical protein D3C74_50290 [compost metagenome]
MKKPTKIIDPLREGVLEKLTQEIQDKLDNYVGLPYSIENMMLIRDAIETTVTSYKLSSFIPVGTDDDGIFYLFDGFSVEDNPYIPGAVSIIPLWKQV